MTGQDLPAPAQPTAKLILASRSPRRRQLLAAAGYRFEVMVPSHTAELPPSPDESPAQAAARLALLKAKDVAGRVAEGVLVACDTLVECQGRILGKPRDREDARRILLALSGREHQVISGLCVWPLPGGEPRVRTATSRLRMDRLGEQQLEEYLDSGLWEGKAGAFGYQDGPAWVHLIEGSESNVVGLPMELLAEMLDELAGA